MTRIFHLTVYVSALAIPSTWNALNHNNFYGNLICPTVKCISRVTSFQKACPFFLMDHNLSFLWVTVNIWFDLSLRKLFYHN